MANEVTAVALAVWARQFSTLINAGVSLLRSLRALEQASDEPLASLTRGIAERVEAGETLSKCMVEHRDVFNPLSISLCRAGEVGGVLDESFAVWADWLERDLEFRGRLDTAMLLAQLRHPARSREEAEGAVRAALPDLEGRVREMTFCRILGMMLESGVPVLQSLDVACNEVFPEDGPARFALMDTAARGGRPLSPVFEQVGLSPFTVHLCAVGEECGTLDRMMGKAADLHQRELEVRLAAALASMVAPEAGPASA